MCKQVKQKKVFAFGIMYVHLVICEEFMLNFLFDEYFPSLNKLINSLRLYGEEVSFKIVFI